MEVQELIRSAEGYFILGDDEEGFKTLDSAMEKYRDEPEAGEFLYVKATELCRDHRTDTEKAKGKKLLKEYVDRFPKGNHFPKVLSQIHGDLASGEQEKQYRTTIELHPQSNERPWAMLQLASLIGQSNPEEALSLRRRLVAGRPASEQAYRALAALAREDFEAGRLKDAGEKLRKCLFDFPGLPCGTFQGEDELLEQVAHKNPELRLPEGKTLPEYTPHWKEGECWEMTAAGASSEEVTG